MNTENTAVSRINCDTDVDAFEVLASLCEVAEPSPSQQDAKILESITRQYGLFLESLTFAQKVDLLEWCIIHVEIDGDAIPPALDAMILELSNDGLLRLMEATIAQIRAAKGGAIDG